MKKNKEKLTRPVKPSPGIRVWYRKQIEDMIERMKKSILRWCPAVYRKEMARSIQKELDRLRKQWTGEFDTFSDSVASRFTKRINGAVSASTKSALAEVGFNVTWKNDRNIKNILTSIRDTQVSLIKSIPEEQLNRVAGILQRGLQNGQDLAYIREELEKGFDISKRRAAMIARDQTNKATFAINRARNLSAGIKEGIWIHIAGKYTSRPTHVAMHHKRFFLEGSEAGMYDSDVGHNVMPGELVNCFPSFVKVTNSAPIKKLYRRRYSGELAKLITDDGTILFTTPNHPILTNRGFVRASQLNVGDNLVKFGLERFDVIGSDEKWKVSQFDELFDSLSFICNRSLILHGSDCNFHGDKSDGDVNVIDVCGFLRDGLKPVIAKSLIEFLFSRTKMRDVSRNLSCDSLVDEFFLCGSNFSSSDIGVFYERFSLLRSKLGISHVLSLAIISALDVLGFKESFNFLSGTPHSLSNGKFGFAIQVVVNNFIRQRIAFPVDRQVKLSSPSSEGIAWNPGSITSILSGNTRGYKFISLKELVFVNGFHGYVYNLETLNGMYNSNYITVHNCQCTYRAVVPPLV